MPKKIDDKVRARAVQMIQGGRALQEIADSLDVSVSYVTKLKAQLDAGALPPGPGAAAAEPRKRKATALPAPVLSVADQLLQPGALTQLANELHTMKREREALESRIQQVDALVKALTPPAAGSVRQTIGDQSNRSNMERAVLDGQNAAHNQHAQSQMSVQELLNRQGLQQGQGLGGSQLNQEAASAFDERQKRSLLTSEARPGSGPEDFGGSDFP